MSRRTGLWIALGCAAVFAAMMYSSFQDVRAYRVEVCMEFQGRQACRSASAASEEDALRAATDNACALISSGMTDSIACGQSAPQSVKWLAGRR
jgi:hypothetical protein